MKEEYQKDTKILRDQTTQLKEEYELEMTKLKSQHNKLVSQIN